ncbi:patatin-like phospholipase family protein [Bradyrhizobium australiense]|uniref:Patatin-like phospholipase family protein n=1 Tax=Bradyrhizobium australiense TaxID=2721161 RepID=A0A7Y4H0I0_9BRAD|nr:patatin-like phospholipase family protein [Bradyrhizobium australiense]NOJ44652.1 patatin-like phospholipase family protein [Bradyrhizobium australiense]
MVKRAITLGGGGPAAGLHIGVLEALAAAGITFDVWALSCIGAWVGVVYNQFGDEKKKVENKDRAELTYQFFKNGVFRDDESYERFPINTVFGPDWRSNIKALNNFVTDPDNYKDFLWDPYKMMDVFQDSMQLVSNQLPRKKKKFKKLDEGDFNRWILNQAMAPNPFVRYFTSMMYLSNVNGLSRINYPESEFMKGIDFDELEKQEKPAIFHNAWNLDEKRLALFSNRKMTNTKEYKGSIDARSLCACSALPFIEGTVEIDGVTYCEGALVDTVNFWSLLEEHDKPEDKLDEIWVSRIVDSKQVRKPENLHDALANLCQLFAATVGEDDVNLFKYHVRYDNPGTGKEWNGTLVEIHVPGHINFKWNHSNLDNGRELGRVSALHAIDSYHKHKDDPHEGKPLFINEHPERDPNWGELRRYYERLKQAAA